MRKDIFKKGMVYAVIFLFIVSSIVSSIRTNAVFLDQVDQQQTETTQSWSWPAPYKGGQSFKPTLNTITRVELLCCRDANASYNLKVSIRSNLNSSDLTSKTISVSSLPIGCWTPSWVDFDFSDIAVTPESTYYIVWSVNSNSSN